MNTLPYYPFYVQDFDESSAVIDMSLDEVGLYVLALNESWKRGYIPADLKALALRIRRPLSAVKKAWPKVSLRWEENGTPGCLINPRQEKERLLAKKKSAQARENIKKRYATGVDTGVDTFVETDVDTPVLQRGSVSVSVSGSKDLKNKTKSEVYLGQNEDFETFWGDYWRKVSKSTACESWRKRITCHDLANEVHRSMLAQKPAILTRPMEARPHASTWINQGRWEDDPAAYDLTSERTGKRDIVAEMLAEERAKHA